jgi:hypothetical protein
MFDGAEEAHTFIAVRQYSGINALSFFYGSTTAAQAYYMPSKIV